MTTWIALRIVKLLAVGLFAAGALGAGFAANQRDRMTAAFWLAAPAFLGTTTAGYAMAKSAGHSLGAPWIALVMFTGLMCFHHSVLASRKPTRRPPFSGLVSGWLVASIVAMVIRDAGAWFWPLTAGLGVTAGLCGWQLAKHLERTRPCTPSEPRAFTLTWFTWMGRLEGTSFIVLLGHVLLREVGGVDLDPWGVIGGLHGGLFVVYLQSLASATRVSDWGRRGVGLGLLASILPFGPFIFEHKVTKAPR